MARSKKQAPTAEAFPARPAAEGTAISIVVHDEERTLEATETADGWAIVPSDAAEAAALERFSAEALSPPAAEAATADDGEQTQEDAGTPAEEDNAS